jgi:hypothetical protein
MHRCQVKMRCDYDTPEDALLDCGDIANKKLGKVWVCNFHFDTYRYIESDIGEEAMSLIKRIVDVRGVKHDE